MEHDEQVCLFYWARVNEGRYPELFLLHAIINGAKLPYSKSRSGKRYSKEGMRLVAEGLKSGVPDVFLPVPKQGFHGLYIEMKYGKNRASENQLIWMDMLERQGYKAVICYGCEEAIAVLEDYLG